MKNIIKEKFIKNLFSINESNIYENYTLEEAEIIKSLIVKFLNGFRLNQSFIEKYSSHMDLFNSFLEEAINQYDNCEEMNIIKDLILINSVKFNIDNQVNTHNNLDVPSEYLF